MYVADGRTSTNVIFAVAEKPSYNLIPASNACKLLKETEVKCTSDSGNTSATGGNGGGDSEFPLWIIYIIAGVTVLAFIIMVIVLRRRSARKVCALMPGSHVKIGSGFFWPMCLSECYRQVYTFTKAI